MEAIIEELDGEALAGGREVRGADDAVDVMEGGLAAAVDAVFAAPPDGA